jgi:hypothetical protein
MLQRRLPLTVLRFLAGLCLIAATIALVADATRPLSGVGHFAPTSLGQLWAETAPNSLAAARTVVSRSVSPAAWGTLNAVMLKLPTFIVLGAIGLLLGWLGRHRARVNVFTN